ncbi:MAG TPA: twin-arginine translocase subunit TatC [Dehalococcoidia bacterium]|nr:twin-arginine translocase subunit TatC [Dehalococcoidia bacterium]
MAAIAPEASSSGSGKELTILEHLQELRQRLMVSAAAIVLGFAASLFLTKKFLEWITVPATNAGQDVSIVFTDVLGYWGAYFRVALLAAIAMAMPILVYEVLAFVSPGLTKQERRWVIPIVLGASFAFVAGAAFAYYVEMPPALRFLLNSSGDIKPMINVTGYVDFVTRLMLVTGLVFELPLFVMGLAKLRVVTSRKLLGWWRYAIVLAFIVSAIVTPSIDPITQSVVAGPMIVLYFAGIALAKLVEKPSKPATNS